MNRLTIIGLLMILGAFNADSARAQVITTYAGNGSQGFGGDGGFATNAQMNRPTGVAVDSLGNLYVAEPENRRVRKVSRSGIISTVAGVGACTLTRPVVGMATSACLFLPNDVAVDANGNLYIADRVSRVLKVDQNGTISTIIDAYPGYSGDGGPAANAQIVEARGLDVGPDGSIYIADTGSTSSSPCCRVRKIAPNGLISTVAGNGTSGYGGDGGSATNASLDNIQDIAVDAHGNIFIADSWRIRKVSTDGIITTVAGTGSSSGNYLEGGLAVNTRIQPSGLVVDKSGAVIASDLNSAVRKISPEGVITTVAGNGLCGFSGDGGMAVDARLCLTGGLAMDRVGNLFIADIQNYRVRRVSSGIFPLSDPTVQQDFNCFGCYTSGKFHTAMDLTSASRTVVAASSGEVHAVYRTDSTANLWCEGGNDRLDEVPKTDYEYGNTFILKHRTEAGGDVFTQYNHLNCLSKAVALRLLDGYPAGDPRRQVNAQSFLGEYGGSGNRRMDKWPAHLHFEVKTFGELAGRDQTNNTSVFSYSSAPGESYGYLDPVTYLYGNQINSDAHGMGIVVDDATYAYEAPGLAIGTSDLISNKIPANALVYIVSTAQMSDGAWYQVNLGLPATAYTDRATKIVDNNSPEGWVHSKHIAPYNGFTFTVPGPQYGVVNVFDIPDGVVVGKVIGGQVFQRYGQAPARTKGKKLCATQWIEIHLGAVISGPDTSSTRQRGWVCESGS